MSAKGKPKNGQKSGIRGGLLLLVLAIILVFIGKSSEFLLLSNRYFGGLDVGSEHNRLTLVSGLIGSEKQPFFDDPEVRARLKELGLIVSVETAGSREIATRDDLMAIDFAFPSSAPAADKIAAKWPSAEKIEPFYSPMAIATFTPVVDVLERAGVVRYEGDQAILDVQAYIDLSSEGKRWRDLGPEIPSSRTVQISSTDIRKSNSAAMYLSLLSWAFTERNPDAANDVNMLANDIGPFFSGQGYTLSSSAGPFQDYLSKGIGAAPMVMIYEAQYLEEAMADHSRLGEQNRLVYPSPTVVASHTILGRTPTGKLLAHLLAEDPKLQELAARHGFRPTQSGSLPQVAAEKGFTVPETIVDTVPVPSYDQLEALITQVSNAYAGGTGTGGAQ